MNLKIDEKEIKKFQNSLIKCGRTNYSFFPWRKTNNKWHALVSEIMLQRTNADQVLPVYIKFCKKYKTPEDLLKNGKRENLFKNLGLYWREQQILKLSEILLDRDIPESRDDLIKLPAIGNYIAFAYRSLHIGKRDVIIDSNVVRIFRRYFGFETDGETRRKKWFIELADRLTPKRRFKKYNYALLDFSRIICTLKPKCELCIVRNRCKYIGSFNIPIGK